MPAIDEGKDRGSNGEATPRRAAEIAVPFKPATTGSARASEPAVVLGLAGEAAEALEVLGLRWIDIVLDVRTLSINRGLVAVGYDSTSHGARPATSRRRIDLDPTTARVLSTSPRQHVEREAVGAGAPD